MKITVGHVHAGISTMMALFLSTKRVKTQVKQANLQRAVCFSYIHPSHSNYVVHFVRLVDTVRYPSRLRSPVSSAV